MKPNINDSPATIREKLSKGGRGSGNFGHSGRPGSRGGSGGSGGSGSSGESKGSSKGPRLTESKTVPKETAQAIVHELTEEEGMYQPSESGKVRDVEFQVETNGKDSDGLNQFKVYTTEDKGKDNEYQSRIDVVQGKDGKYESADFFYLHPH